MSFNALRLQRETMSPNSTMKLMPTCTCGLWLSVKTRFRVVSGLLNLFKKQMQNIPHKAESESSESAVKRMCFWECLHLFLGFENRLLVGKTIILQTRQISSMQKMELLAQTERFTNHSLRDWGIFLNSEIIQCPISPHQKQFLFRKLLNLS